MKQDISSEHCRIPSILARKRNSQRMKPTQGKVDLTHGTWEGKRERVKERKKEKTGEGEEWIKEEERKIETGRKSKTEKPRFL